MNQSYVVKELIQLICFWCPADMVSHEVAKLVRILQDWWYSDWTTPVHIVETLAVHKFLQHSFLNLGVSEKDFEVDWFHSASVAVLGDQVEIIIFGYDFAVHECTISWVCNISALQKELLLGTFIRCHECKSGVIASHALQFLLYLVDLAETNIILLSIRHVRLDNDNFVRQSRVRFRVRC